MDDARKLLDSLMGPSRDKSSEEQQKSDGWKDRNVCKRFLVGFCPNTVEDNWFKNTRRDPGTCTKIHSERLKQQFEEHPDRMKYEAEYKKDFLVFLEGLVYEADAWIAREKGNCKPGGKVTKMPPHAEQTAASLIEQSEQLMKTAEDIAETGDLAKSKEAVQKATELREEADAVRQKYTFVSVGEEVCEVCGVRCNPDEQEHYKAHFDGKLHEVYTRVRQARKDLRERHRSASGGRREGGEGRERRRDRDAGGGGRGGGGGRDRAAEKGGRERSRERGRGDRGDRAERDQRGKDRERDRGDRDRGRDRDRGGRA